MRFSGWWALVALLWAAAAVAQPEIVDPDTKDDDPNPFRLAIEEVLPTTTLTTPDGLVFIGDKENEEFLLLEKDTGKIRHFSSRVEQAVALDLAVDSCGERGLIGIALHPGFEPGAHVPDLDHPEKDWVYVSHHANASNTDSCDPSAAVFHVDRYTWNGTTLVNPASMYTKNLAAGEIDAVGGGIATTSELQLIAPATVVPRLYILMGSLGRNGKLQNNASSANPLDDTSVILRLKDDGTTPPDNPFDDADTATPETKDRYFAYGIRDPRGWAVDDATQSIWFTEQSDAGKPDEINLLFATNNGGYKDYQGKVVPLKNDDDDYPLFDLAQTNTTPPKPISTFLLPRFSFEDPVIDPTGIAFGGREVGPQHRDAAFVGTAQGDLYRFPLASFRAGFQLSPPLTDQVADLAHPMGDPVTTEPDDLKQIFIGKRFGRISALQTGVDGSIYALSLEGNKLYRVFSNATRDLEFLSAKVPTRITVSAKKPVVTKNIRLNLVNNGEVSERIDTHDQLMRLIGLEITSTTCAEPEADVIDPKYVSPPYSYPIGIKLGGGKLALEVAVQWSCPGLAPGAEAEFDTVFVLNTAVIGVADSDTENNVCPRESVAPDPGCGPKGDGDSFVTGIIQK